MFCAANKEHWDELSEAEFFECEDGVTDCLSFDVSLMCKHYMTDHNYYAVCRNMLSKYADDRVNGGYPHLLHDMPPHASVSLATPNFSFLILFLPKLSLGKIILRPNF